MGTLTDNPRKQQKLAAKATVDSISGRKAICLVEIAGTTLPVEFPADLLHARNLKVGMRFLWWMSQDGSVVPQNIDDLPQNHLTAREIEESKRIAEKLRHNESADDWVEFMGDGR
jgi:hypothetical protein